MIRLLHKQLGSVRSFHRTGFVCQLSPLDSRSTVPTSTQEKSNRFQALYTSGERSRPASSGTHKKQHRIPVGGSSASGNLGSAPPNRFASAFDHKSPPRFTDHPRKSKNRKHDARPEKITRFEFNTGSEHAKTALKTVLRKVREYDLSLKVRFLDSETKKITTANLVDISNALNLETNGLMVLPPSEGLAHPMVKIIPVASMLRTYADQLAAQKERELLDMGSASAKRARNQRLKVEKKKLATKFLNISWKISLGDLNNQKRDEIQRRLAKNEKFIISVTGKPTKRVIAGTDDVENAEDLEEPSQASPQSIRFSKEFANEQDLLIELKRRDNLQNGLCAILDEQHCTYEIEGNTETRLMVRVTPKEANNISGSASKPVQEEVSAKELRRQRRAEKQKLSLSNATPDLDLLYSMKIED